MPLAARAAAILRSLHWGRGLRAGFAVATAMVVCRMIGRPMGWAALGGFEAVLVDNGGPYRSRLYTIVSVLVGGALCGIIGTLVPPDFLIAVLVTAAVCFAVTYARVASQPIASTAVIILVIYFAGFGATDRTLDAALANALSYILGGLWAAVLSLFLWPLDPFRPARIEVAGCYDLLAAFSAGLHAPAPQPDHTGLDADHAHATDFKRQLRAKLESARAALSDTPARAPSRTIRARSLSVLLETADLLFALIFRLNEFVEITPAGAADADTIRDIAAWLSGAEAAIANALRARPPDHTASFKPTGSHRIQFIARRAAQLASQARTPDPLADPLAGYLLSAQLEALQNFEIAFEAVRAVWTGVEARPGRLAEPLPQTSGAPSLQPHRMAGMENAPSSPAWLDALGQNWSLHSVMMRHALRTAVVGAVDVVLIRAFHISHGFWLGMTSIIVLQPYSSGTVRKGLQRVAGTVGGGFLAALLAATIHTDTGIVLVITACSILTLALYAIDYGWYSFFLTPTFVLLSLPYLRDWRFASVRILTTLVGALVSVIAMRVLWPQSLRVELGRLLARSASATATYLHAVLEWWSTPAPARKAAERTLLAPARRACGLTSQDAEEALDRVMLEPGLPTLGPDRRHALETEAALTFTTYIRRFTQCLTTLAVVGTPDAPTNTRLTTLNRRLAAACAALDRRSDCASAISPDLSATPGSAVLYDLNSPSEQMLQRMERQAGILERAAAVIATGDPSQSEPRSLPS